MVSHPYRLVALLVCLTVLPLFAGETDEEAQTTSVENDLVTAPEPPLGLFDKSPYYMVDQVIPVRDFMTVEGVLPSFSPTNSENPFRTAQETLGFQPFDVRPGFDTLGSRQPFEVLAPTDIFGTVQGTTTTREITTAPLFEGINSSDVLISSAPDVGAVLQSANDVQTIGTQRRSPIAFDPHIRGYKHGQIYATADGAFWWPTRLDLDTMLAKIDPWLIKDVLIIPGPYGLRYGPGFSFIDVVTYDTPRYCQYESHGRVGYSLHTNGGQNYGRASSYGGNQDWGYIVSYGARAGADYDPGGNAPLARIPASYKLQSFSGQFGFDLPCESKLEMRYVHLDGSDIEYAAQIFDIDAQSTDAVTMTYILPDQYYGGDFRVTGWFNKSRFTGSFPPASVTSSKRLPTFSVVDRIEDALGGTIEGNTAGDVTSTGARAWRTFGDSGSSQVRVGGDFNWVDQSIEEQFNNNPAGGPLPMPVLTNMPRSQMYDTGAFAEWIYQWSPYFETAIGGRVDWVHTTAQAIGDAPFGWPNGVRGNTSLQGVPESLPQNDTLYAFYATSDLAVTDEWDVRLGFGHAQRAPTLIERYADGIFMGIIQSGFSRVIGDPNLDKERAWQIDLGLVADHERWRGKASVYYSWVFDYITYGVNPIADPTGARLLVATNSDLATLAGFELYGEYDVYDWLSAFASLSYVEGRDREINTALPQILPLQSRAGVRVHQIAEQPQWGLEFYALMADNQDMIGFLRPVAGGGSSIPVELPTAGYMYFNLRGYWAVSDRLNVIGGVDNLFDRTYLTHLDLRLPDSGQFTNTTVFSPGITPYAGVEWQY